MGAPIQCTMFFSQGNGGWSEVLVMSPVSFTTIALAQTEVTKQGGLGQRRAKLLGDNVKLLGIRLSKVGVWRDSNYTANANGTPPGKIWDPPTFSIPNPAVPPFSVQAVRMECGDSYRRLVYLSGIPDIQYVKSDPSGWGKQFIDDFNAYFDYLTGKGSFDKNKYGTMVSTKDTNDPPTANINVTPPNAPAYALVGGQGQLTLTRTGPATFVGSGQKVRLLGVKGPPGVDLRKWNGIFTCVNPLVGNTFTIATKISPAQDDFPQLDFTSAYVFVPTQQFQAFTDWDLEGKTHRKRGVAFGTPRGRSRTQG